MVEHVATAKTAARIGILAVVLTCTVALAGWFLGIPVLASIVPGWPRIALIVIVCFLLCAIALFNSTLPVKHPILARQGPAAIVMAVGVYSLVTFAVTGGLRGATAPSGQAGFFDLGLGHPSFATAFCFVIAAAALLLPRGNRWGGLYSGLLAIGLAACGLNFVGYAYGIAALSRGPTISAMSLPTLVCFVLLFVSALLARPNAGWIAVILARNSGGVAARRFFPAVLVLPFVINGILVVAYRSNPFETLFGFAFLAVITSAALGFITITIARWLARYESERRRSQDLLEAIVENSAAVIYVKDLAGRYLMVNRRFLDIFQIDRQAVMGRTDYDLFSKPGADALRAVDERAARAQHPLMEEETVPQGDGLHTYVSVKAPLKDEAGRPYAIFGISTDITERKRAELAVAASEERTRQIVETALDAVISIDDQGIVSGWNSQAERVFGWNAEEVIGRPVETIIVPAAYRDAHRNGLARYLTTAEARILNRRIEMTALDRSGREFPIELSITAIRSGDKMGFTAFIRDITEQKNAKIRVQTQLGRLGLLERITRAVGQRQDMQSIFQVVVRTLEDQMPADFVCICSYNPARNDITVNHVGVNSAGLGLELGIIERANIPIDENGLSRCVRGALVHEPDIAGLDFPFPRRLARQGLRSLVIAPLTIEGEVFGVLIVSRIEENAFSSTDCEFLRQLGDHVGLAAHQVKLRGSLEEAYNDLKQTQQAVLQQERLRALGQMASGIAHDINNAISPVAVYTQSLLEREPALSSRVRSYLETVQRVVKDVSATVSRMRDFYRRNDSDAELHPVNLNDLVPQVVELTRARWSDMPQQRGIVIRVVIQLEADLPPLMGNATEIREAMTNLIFNAVDAMPQGGTITIRTQSLSHGPDASSGRLVLQIEDSGIGMDESTRLRCLEPFFTTKGERGTGLGLAMVYGAARRHKASLDIDSAPGRGTRISLEFAATETRAEKQRAIDVSEIPPLRLLLVDDDPAVLNSMQIVLELDGHTILPADGGQAGMQALRTAKEAGESFDLLVTDLGMPYVDGMQVAQLAKELFPAMGVVLLTGWGRKMGDDDAPSSHVDYTLPKPLDLDELRTIFARRFGSAP